MKPDRAAGIVGGLAILIGLMKELGIKAMTPVEAGLRMGVLWDLQLRETKRRHLQVARSAHPMHAPLAFVSHLFDPDGAG